MTIEKLSATTPDLTKQNVELIAELFPECVTEGPWGTASDAGGPVIDFDLLRQALSDHVVEGPQERYRLDWPGKRQALLTANTPIERTLRPMREESVDFDTTRNLFIEGDNLDALKLLQETYLGKVKVVFIDPPYNTGKDFIYKDNFSQSREDYESDSGQRDEEGGRLVANPETNGRFHSDWLSMMYPRLKLARNLLCEDGVLFVTIGDSEAASVIALCDEIFGEANRRAVIAWQKKYAVSQDDPGFGSMHDSIIVYSKSGMFSRNILPREDKQISRYSNPDLDNRGPWAADNYIGNNSKHERPTLWYSIKHPATGEPVWPKEGTVWRYSQDKHAQIESENRLYWGPNNNYARPRIKKFLNEIQSGVVPSTWWPFGEVGHNDEAQKETAEILGPKVFTTPKPLRLLRRILSLATDGAEAIILDFFAGSGSIGHAVMAQNAADGGSRAYILVQLQEPLNVEVGGQTVAVEFCDTLGKPRNVAELTKERLRRAGVKLLTENPDLGRELINGIHKSALV